MKNYMKITGVIAVLLSMTTSVKAEKAAETPVTQEERESGYAMLGHLWATAQKHLTDEENEQIRKLIGEGWKRKNSGKSQETNTKAKKQIQDHVESSKPNISFKDADNEELLFGRVWLHAREHLTEEEKKVFHHLLQTGLGRGLQSSIAKEQKQTNREKNNASK